MSVATEKDALNWNDNAAFPITDEPEGETLLIRFRSVWNGITHTDEIEGEDYTVDLSWMRGKGGTIAATTGQYTNDDIHSWKRITPKAA